MLFFFFSSRRRHTRFSRDWSSDVCSSDLATRRGTQLGPRRRDERGRKDRRQAAGAAGHGVRRRRLEVRAASRDRKSVVEGKSGALGGGRRMEDKAER